MTKEYLVTYIIDGISKAEQVFARNEYQAIRRIYEIENISSAYVDFAIIRVELWHNKKYYKVTL
jgi:hypothetical protein